MDSPARIFFLVISLGIVVMGVDEFVETICTTNVYNVATLSCPGGYIHITEATFGKTPMGSDCDVMSDSCIEDATFREEVEACQLAEEECTIPAISTFLVDCASWSSRLQVKYSCIVVDGLEGVMCMCGDNCEDYEPPPLNTASSYWAFFRTDLSWLFDWGDDSDDDGDDDSWWHGSGDWSNSDWDHWSSDWSSSEWDYWPWSSSWWLRTDNSEGADPEGPGDEDFWQPPLRMADNATNEDDTPNNDGSGGGIPDTEHASGTRPGERAKRDVPDYLLQYMTSEPNYDGYLHSPGYPNEYQPYRDCACLLAAEEGTEIWIQSLVFRLEYADPCSYDHVSVKYDGQTDSYCGYEGPNGNFGTNLLNVSFYSDHLLNYDGFLLKFWGEKELGGQTSYMPVTAVCGADLSGVSFSDLLPDNPVTEPTIDFSTKALPSSSTTSSSGGSGSDTVDQSGSDTAGQEGSGIVDQSGPDGNSQEDPVVFEDGDMEPVEGAAGEDPDASGISPLILIGAGSGAGVFLIIVIIIITVVVCRRSSPPAQPPSSADESKAYESMDKTKMSAEEKKNAYTTIVDITYDNNAVERPHAKRPLPTAPTQDEVYEEIPYNVTSQGEVSTITTGGSGDYEIPSSVPAAHQRQAYGNPAYEDIVT